ncbi:MAG: efflux RND transporter periplasmic adaptor subunit [Nitrospirae bacterium]|nr:efflux RND transporter periplasmic adaptor subunit [Nitrospirota bacterium]
MKIGKNRFPWIKFIFLAIFVFGMLGGCRDHSSNVNGQEEKRKVMEKQNKDKESEEKKWIRLSPEAQKEAGIKIEEVSFHPLEQDIQIPGTIQINENQLAHVGTRIPGRITEISAALGEWTAKGSPLASMDSPELGQAQSEYLNAKAKAFVAEKAYDRAKKLLEGKVIGRAEFQRREGDYIATKTEGQTSREKLRLLGMTQEALEDLENRQTVQPQFTIFSPLSGKVIERNVTLGEMVEPSKTLFTIANLSRLWGIAELPEQELSKVKKGLLAKVSVNAFPKESFQGRITYISDLVDPVTRTVKVRVEIDNSSGRLKPQMFASFRVSTGDTEKKLTLPDSAVVLEGDKTIVFILNEGTKEGKFEKREVLLGPETQGYYPVLSGLKQGEKVVTKGAFVLKSENLKGLMEE